MDKDETITFRLPKALKLALMEAAKKERRSIGQFLNLMIEDHLKVPGDREGGAGSRGRGRANRKAARR
jgi:hypothetical protein